MKDLQIFKNEEFGEVRTLEINNEPWFVAKDICDVLEIKNTTQAINRLDNDERTMLNIGRQGNTNFINEYGLYNLILASRKKEAKEFKRWITHEVIPSIRKNGGYLAGQEQMTEEEIMAKALVYANNKINDLKFEKDKLEIQNNELSVSNAIMKPKAEYFDDLVDRNLLTNFTETAKELNIKRKYLIEFLLEKKYVFRNKKGKLEPYANKNDGLFELKESKNEKTGWVGTQTLITPKGRETFRMLCLGL